MHKARAFFYVCAGLFLLALSYHLGARNAGAQTPDDPVVAAYSNSGANVVITSHGDVYVAGSLGAGIPWDYRGNVFGGATPAQRESFGALKSRYRGERGATQPTPQDR